MSTITENYLKLNANDTLLDDKIESVKTQLALYDVLIPSFGAVIILLNLIVVISSGLILKKGQNPRSTYLFLGNVALTDLITGIAVVFGQVFPIAHRDHYVCAVQLGMIVSSTLTSIYSVGLIAIDRFLYIIHGIHYQQWVYPNRARILIFCSWIIGCLVGFLPLLGWYGDTDNGKVCWFIRLAPKELILLTVMSGVIPILIVVILYSVILYHAIVKIIQLKKSTNTDFNNRNLRMFRGNTSDSTLHIEDDRTPDTKGFFANIFRKKPTSTVKSPSKWKAIKVVLFTTCSFIITWCPYFITSIYYVYKCENVESKKCKNLQLIIASPLAILGFTNSLINPMIYAWWHKGFREFVHKRVSIVIMKTRGTRNNSIIDNSHSIPKPIGGKTSTNETASK